MVVKNEYKANEILHKLKARKTPDLDLENCLVGVVTYAHCWLGVHAVHAGDVKLTFTVFLEPAAIKVPRPKISAHGEVQLRLMQSYLLHRGNPYGYTFFS